MKSQEEKLLKRIKREKIKQFAIESSGLREHEPNLKILSDTLDEYYFLEKLKVYCAYLSYSKIINPKTIGFNKSNLKLIEEIVSESTKHFKHKEIFQIYLGIKELFETIDQSLLKNDELFNSIESLIDDKLIRLSNPERVRLYSYLSNYSIRQINLGHKQHKPRFFFIQYKMLNIKYKSGGSTKEVLPSSVFINMVRSALSLKNDPALFGQLVQSERMSDQESMPKNIFEWVSNFMNYYKNFLDNKGMAICFPYCQALYHFENKEFLLAYRSYPNPIRAKGLFLNMLTRLLQIKICYEILITQPEIMESDGITIQQIQESYRGLLRHEKEKKQKQSYQIHYFSTFEELFKDLMKHRNRYAGKLLNQRDAVFQKEKEKLIQRIKTFDFPYCEWFLLKIQGIK